MGLLPDQKDIRLSKYATSPELIQVMLHEYDALRAEILKRIEIMYQISALALIAPATLFTFGLGTQNASVILVYPVLSLFLALLWCNYDGRCRQLGYYIKTQIEICFGDNVMCWEHYMDTNRSKHLFFDWGNLWATLGIFIGSDILAFVVGIPVALRYGTILPLKTILVAAIGSTLITGIRIVKPPHLKKEPLKKKGIDLLMPNTNTDRK